MLVWLAVLAGVGVGSGIAVGGVVSLVSAVIGKGTANPIFLEPRRIPSLTAK